MPAPYTVEETHGITAITNALIANLGVFSKTAKTLGCDHGALIKCVKNNPELHALANELRKSYVESRKDTAESVMDILMRNADSDDGALVGHAFKASQFILNNHGRDRDYAHPHAKEADEGEQLTPEQFRRFAERNSGDKPTIPNCS